MEIITAMAWTLWYVGTFIVGYVIGMTLVKRYFESKRRKIEIRKWSE